MNVGDTEVVVVSEVLLDPEALVITRVFRGEEELKKQVATVPAATVADYERRGRDALSSFLHAAHLRFLQRLLGAPPATARPRFQPGVLAALSVGVDGTVTASAGEDQVPPSWQRAAVLTHALLDRVARDLGLGAPVRAHVAGESLAAVVGRFGERGGVLFVEPTALGALGTLAATLEELACGSS